MEKKYNEFKGILPKGNSYSNDDYRMLYILTNREQAAWKRSKPKRAYLESLRDTIDNYLNTQITQQDIERNELDCFEEYDLTFSKNGNLDKVTVLDSSKPRIRDGLSFYFEDRREIRKCKKIIKRMFREITLSPFDLKYKVERVLSFGYEGKINLTDRTIY